MLHDVVSVLGALEVVWSALGAKTGMGYYWDFGVLSGRRGGGAFVPIVPQMRNFFLSLGGVWGML